MQLKKTNMTLIIVLVITLYFAGMDTKRYRDNDFSIDTHWDEFIIERAISGRTSSERSSSGQKINR